MMNASESVGESSCKRQENGDASTGSERPLKKARFAWQVKGKYHLKNDIVETTHTSPNEADKAGCSSQSSHDNLVGNTEQNLEILGDYLLKQDFNTLDSVITDSDKSLLKPSSSISNDKLDFPRYISSFENDEARTLITGSSEQRSVPVSMVLSNSYSEDQCIARWQARQMAKGFVDNTINRVLESWMVTPLPADIGNNRFLALDVAEFINDLPDINSIENEGILMAISAHGLQSNSNSNSSDDSQNVEQICSSSTKDMFHSRSCSPQSDDDSKYEPMDENRSSLDANLNSVNDLNMTWSYNDDRIVNSASTPFSLFPQPSSPSYVHYSANDNLQNSIEFEDGNTSPRDDMLASHFDFMDAAVTFAIQNKGLTSFGTDYG